MVGLFDNDQQEVVLEWLSCNWKRPRVVIVGSGFTRNSLRPRATTVPLWNDLARAIEDDLNIPQGRFDALQLPDLHGAKYGNRRRLRKLLAAQLDDSALRPGRAHDALWESQPAAVLTTNFLDTVLEKSKPGRAQVITDDTDVGRPIEPNRRHVIYFHGHRNRPETWIAGRQEYEQLPTQRPIVHAKVRQLLAEFPALIVGYSLADPDFHFIYGETVRAMGNARPLGLALLPTETRRRKNRVQDVVAEGLNRTYWRTLGLRIVRFSAAASRDPDEAYARFFKLTERIDTLNQLFLALRRPEAPTDVPAAFRENIEVGRFALEDSDSTEVLSSPYHRHRWWREVLLRSLDAAARLQATEDSTSTNLTRHRATEPRNGEVKGSRGRRVSTVTVSNRDAWVRGPHRWRNSAAVNALLEQLDGGDETLRQLEQVLTRGADRAAVRGWIHHALTDPESEPRFINRSHISSLALLADGRRRLLLTAHDIAVDHGEPTTAKIIRAKLRRVPPRRPQPRGSRRIRNLQRAFKLLAEGRHIEAIRLYSETYEEFATAPQHTTGANDTLLAYFALRGVLDCTPWDADTKEVEELTRRRDILSEEPPVRRWLERARTLREDALKTRAKAQMQGRDGYEVHGGSWSATPGELWHGYEKAKKLGASLSIRRELLAPLLDTIPSAALELRERLALNVEGNGEWIKSTFEGGGFGVDRGAFFRETPRLTRSQRCKAARAVARELLPRAVAKLRPNGLAHKSRAAALGDVSEVLLQRDVARAITLLGSGSRDSIQSSEIARAWLKVSHLCSWSQVRRPFMAMVGRRLKDRALLMELFRSNTSLPWEHWSECDNFWTRGGLDLLRSVVRISDRFWTAQVGWLLSSLKDTAPRQELEVLCCRWLGEQKQNLADGDTLNAAASILTFIPANMASASPILRAAKKRKTFGLLAIMSQPFARKSMNAWANRFLDDWVDRRGWRGRKPAHSFGARDELAEAHCLVAVIQRSPERRAACVVRLLQLFDATWSALPAAAPVFHPAYWGKHWPRLLQMLRLGGHSRVAKSWLVARVRLVSEIFHASGQIVSNFMNSGELSFLRSSIIDAIAHGDSFLANNAVYVLPSLARMTIDETEAAAIGAALKAAVDDIRIGVAHSAAFSAGYIRHYSRYKMMRPELVGCARWAENLLQKDPLAIIQRQLEFGRAKGTRYGQKVDSDEVGTAP